MQQFFKRIGAFLLAILICVATSSFTLNMHYCGAKMVSYNTLGKAKPCCKANSLQLSKSDNVVAFGMSCCKDKQLEKESQDELTYTVAKVKVELKQFLLRLPQLLDDEFSIKATYLCSVNKKSQNYFLPYDQQDRCVLFQRFLI